MKTGRKFLIILGALALATLITASSVSFEYRPTVFKTYYPGYNSYERNFNVTFSPSVQNWSINITEDGHSGRVYLTLTGGLIPFRSQYENNSYNLIKGTVIISAIASLSIANVTSNNFLSSLTFYVTDASLATNNSTLIFPLDVGNFYPSGISIYNNNVVTSSSGISISSSEPVYNLALLKGWVSFWLNFTVVPVVVYGPFYTTGTPVPVSISWDDYFVNQ